MLASLALNVIRQISGAFPIPHPKDTHEQVSDTDVFVAAVSLSFLPVVIPVYLQERN